jgi:hypothetical protein
VSWSVNYDGEHFEYGLPGPIEFEKLFVELGFWPQQTLRIFTTQGLESDYSLVDAYSLSTMAERPGLDKPYWYVGLDWEPNEHSTTVVSVGERQFGHTYNIDWSYYSSLGGVNLSYSEQPNTFLRDQLYSAHNAGEFTPIDTPDGPRGNPFYLEKLASAVFLLDRPRSHVALRLSREERFDILAATDDVKTKTEEYDTVELSFGWNMTPVAFLSLGTQISNRKSALSQINDRISYTILTWGHQVGRRGEFTASLSHERGVPNNGSAFNDYQENQISVGIRRRFGSVQASGVPERFKGYLNAPPGR